MGAVAAALIAATGLKLMGALGNNPMGRLACLGWAGLAFVAVALLRWPLAGVIAGLGVPACWMAARAIQRREGRGAKP
jgi:chromate transporter